MYYSSKGGTERKASPGFKLLESEKFKLHALGNVTSAGRITSENFVR